MMGKLEGEHVGCIPRLCAHLFARIQAVRALRPTTFKVEASYLEIYNEKVRTCICASALFRMPMRHCTRTRHA